MNGGITIVLKTMYIYDTESKTATAADMQHRAVIIAAFDIKFSEKKLPHSGIGEGKRRERRL